MAETQPELPPAAPAETMVYRRVSHLAIAGLSLAGLYAALVLATSAVALVKGAPFFFPGWMVLMAVAAAVISILGRWQIRNSEGVLAGEALARWGIWLSVITGVGYTAYVYFTGLALAQQADQFLTQMTDDDSGFFPRLKKGTTVEINHAFLLTRPYDRRGGSRPQESLKHFDAVDPKSGADGELTQFREFPLVQTIALARDDAEIESQGVQEWKYEQGGYQVFRTYRLKTPEVAVEFMLPVMSTEGDSTDGQRKWFAYMGQVRILTVELTEFGAKLRKLRKTAQKQLESVRTVKPFPEVILPPGEDEQWRQQIADSIAKADNASTATFRTPFDDDTLPNTKMWPTPWERLKDGKIRFIFPCLLQADASGLPYRARIMVHVETDQPYDVNAGGEPPTWKLAKVQVVRLTLLGQKKQTK